MLEADAVDVPAGRRDPLRGDHRLLRVDALCRARGLPLSLTADPRSTCIPARADRSAPRVLPRPRPDRAAALRRRREPGRRGRCTRRSTVPATASSSNAPMRSAMPLSPRIRRPRQPERLRPVGCATFARGGCSGRCRRDRAECASAGLEIYFEHFSGSFGDKWMWTPVVLSPALVPSGFAAVRSERAARTGFPCSRRSTAWTG